MSESSVINREIEHFDRLAETWWDDSGPMWPLHRLNALRVPFIARHIAARFGRDARTSILDVGCGAGILSESMARLGATVHGIDASTRNIEIARRHARESGLDIRYDASPIEALDPDHSFDVVLNMEVVEHVDDVSRFMANCASRVRPGGLMFVATINRTLYSFATAIVGAEYVLRWLPRGTHHWRQFVTPGETRGYLERDGFEVGELTGVGVNPLKRDLFLTTNTMANYMLVAQRGDRAI